ncbi:MAG TPA: hypothetical protein PKA66_02170 [Gemmatimonadales bacterium]|nr:hypothetical protein [Gemmatimonadales bacterium]
MTRGATRAALERLVAPLARRAMTGGGMLVLATLLLVLGAAAWLARLGVVESLWWVPMAWAVAVTVAVAVASLSVRRAQALRVPTLARRLEFDGAWRLGALTGMLAEAADGGSADLHLAADRAVASDLASRGPAALAPLTAQIGKSNRVALIALALGAAGLVGVGPARAPVRMLWHPADAWALATGAVRVDASELAVNRGEEVALRLRAPGRRTATLWRRAPGETWRAEEVALDSVGEATIGSGPLTADLFVRATSGGRASDTLHVTVRMPAFLGSVTVTAQYPRYLGLEDESLSFGPDSIVLPEGTRLVVEGEATAPLTAAELVGPRVAVSLDVAGGRFSGRTVPLSSGAYRLDLTTASGTPLAGNDGVLHLLIAPDSAPVVGIPVPGADTLAPLGLRVPMVVDARDDHGVTSLAIVSRRISRFGTEDPERRDLIPVPEGAPDRLIVPYLFDLEGRSLLPGDTVRYYAVAIDNAPRGRTGRSPEYVLRLPTMAEVRAAERSATESVGAQLDSLAAASKQLQRQTEDLSREASRSTSEQSGRREAASMSFEEAKRAEAVARQQEALVRQAEETRAAIEDLQRAAAETGTQDPEFQRRMQEIAEQLDRALTPEMRQQLEELRQALSQLDAARSRQALEDLAEAQRQLKEALERSQKLFERAAMEGEMANLEAEARDLEQEQRRWNEAVDQADAARSAEQEEALAERADSLASALMKAAQNLDQMQQGEQADRMEASADAATEAAEQMDQAAASAKQGKPQDARQQGKQAEQKLQSLGKTLEEQRKDVQGEWKAEVVAAIDQMMAETSRLADRQLAITEALRNGESPSNFRAQQAAVEEGVGKLTEQYKQVSGENALVSPQIGSTLEAARRQMQGALEALSTAVPGQRDATGRAGEAVDALNAAAYQMSRARGDVSGSGSGSGLAEAMARMNQMAQQQGQLSQQGAQMLPMVGNGSMQEQIRRLSEQQRALAEQLERLRAETQSDGAGELAGEARDLARQMEAGRLDRRTVERQERLFRRMLDAGRTLQGEERDDQKERQSTTGNQDEVRLPPALRTELEGDGGRVRLPTWEQLQGLSPEDRRMVLEYFRRLTERPAP